MNAQFKNLSSDMHSLTEYLKELSDESIPINKRIEDVRKIKGMDHGIFSPILLIIYPDKYGVRNSKSEICLKEFGLWPTTNGSSTSEVYVNINEVLLRLAEALSVDLWTLDALFHYYIVQGWSEIPPVLMIGKGYTRRNLHSIFDGDKVYRENGGKWGTSEVVKLYNASKTHVLLVTLGKVKGEGVTKDGFFYWTPQDSMKDDSPKTILFRNQQMKETKIYIFVREKAGRLRTHSWDG